MKVQGPPAAKKPAVKAPAKAVAPKTPVAKKPAAKAAPKKAPAVPKKKPPVLVDSFGEKLVTAELAAAAMGIHEVGPDNHGPWVKKFLAEVGLPEGYAWCDAFQSYEEHGVAGVRLPIESASVEQTYEIAKTYGWLVEPPQRGDLGCVNWNGAGPPFGDHIVLVVQLLAVTATSVTVKTVEGNTSSGAAGSQSNGDGVYVRERTFNTNQVAWVRIPANTK